MSERVISRPTCFNSFHTWRKVNQNTLTRSWKTLLRDRNKNTCHRIWWSSWIIYREIGENYYSMKCDKYYSEYYEYRVVLVRSWKFASNQLSQFLLNTPHKRSKQFFYLTLLLNFDIIFDWDFCESTSKHHQLRKQALSFGLCCLLIIHCSNHFSHYLIYLVCCLIANNFTYIQV